MSKTKNKNHKAGASEKARLIWYGILIVYLAVLLFLIFDWTERTPSNDTNVNLVFFQEIKRFYYALKGGYITTTAALNLFGNVLLFVPLGFLVPLISNRRWTGLKTAIAAVVLVSSIEVYQLISKTGVFDVDDFILNWFGVFLGWLLYKAAACIKHASQRRRK